MDGAVKNICKILEKSDDVERHYTGCLVICNEELQEECLKIATSKKIFLKPTNAQFTASFLNREPIELKISPDDQEDGEIAYVSLDESLYCRLPEGLHKANLDCVDDRPVQHVVPIYENMEAIGATSQIEIFNLVKSQDKYKLEKRGRRVIDKYSDCAMSHLAGRGAPILNGQYEFDGVIDFLEDSNNKSLQVIFHGVERDQGDVRTDLNNRRLKGEVIVRCNFKTAAGAQWITGSAYFNQRYAGKLDKLKQQVQEVLSPSFLVREIVMSQCDDSLIKLIIQAKDLDAIEELYSRYETGKLKEDLERVFLKDEEINRTATEQQVKFIVEISEDDYKQVCTELVPVSIKPVNMPSSSASLCRQQGFYLPGDLFKKLWETEIYFRDEFCEFLDLKYQKIKYWRHFAHELGINPDIIDSFSQSDVVSPMEAMFDKLETTKPRMTVEYFYKKLNKVQRIEAQEVANTLKKENNLKDSDLVSVLCDKVPKVFDQMLLKLDKQDIWKEVAATMDFTKREYEAFPRNKEVNPTSKLFNILKAQGPELKVEGLKKYLKLIGKDNLLQLLEESGISDCSCLKKVSNDPNLMIDIEHILNNPKDNSLWRLAGYYDKEGKLRDVDISIFKYEETLHSPTQNLMNHINTHVSEDKPMATIKFIVKTLIKMNRYDIVGLIKDHLVNGQSDIENMKHELKRDPAFSSSVETNYPSQISELCVVHTQCTKSSFSA